MQIWLRVMFEENKAEVKIMRDCPFNNFEVFSKNKEDIKQFLKITA
jgi:hypothetical protein